MYWPVRRHARDGAQSGRADLLARVLRQGDHPPRRFDGDDGAAPRHQGLVALRIQLLVEELAERPQVAGVVEVGEAPVEYIGNMNTTPVNNNIKISRFTVYKNKPVKFQLYVWRN